jgi:hypothetical protein
MYVPIKHPLQWAWHFDNAQCRLIAPYDTSLLNSELSYGLPGLLMS